MKPTVEDSMVRALWILVCLASGLAPSRQDPKAPIPNAAAQKEKETFIRDIYKEEYKSKDPSDRIAFAEKLIKQAKETKTDTDAQYIMLRKAMTIASDERAVKTV